MQRLMVSCVCGLDAFLFVYDVYLYALCLAFSIFIFQSDI